MVRLSKLSGGQQASWGPHSLSSSIDRDSSPSKLSKSKITVRAAIVTPRKRNGKLPALVPTKEEKARNSPYIKHMIRRDREHMLHRLGAVKDPVGNFKYECILTGMLHNISPLKSTPSFALTALDKSGNSSNVRSVNQSRRNMRSSEYSCNGSLSSSTSSLSGVDKPLSEYSWWKESDEELFNFPNPTVSHCSAAYCSDELVPKSVLEPGSCMQDQAMPDPEFDPPPEGLSDYHVEELAEENDELISTASEAENGMLEDELLSSHDSDDVGDICTEIALINAKTDSKPSLT